LRKIELSDSIFGEKYINENYRKHKPLLFINNSGNVYCMYKKAFYRINYTPKSHTIKLNFLSNITEDIDKFYYKTSITIGDNIINYSSTSNSKDITIININTGKEFIYSFPITEPILYIQPEKNRTDSNIFHVFTKSYVYECVLDTNVNIKRAYSIKELISDTSVKGFKISAWFSNSSWKNCLASPGNGLYIGYDKIDNFIQSPFQFSDFTCVGTYKDSLSFWWNKQQSILATYDVNGRFKTTKNDALKDVKSISYYNLDTFFVNSNFPFLYKFSSNQLFEQNHFKFGTGIFNSYFINPDNFLATGSYGFYEVKIQNDTYKHNIIDYSRYNGIIFNRNCGIYVINSNNTILLYDRKTSNFLSRTTLHDIGINSVKQICVDDCFGNTFVRSFDNVSLLDLKKRTSKALFDNFKFKDNASVLVHNDKLVIVWKYGVLFSTILGYNNISKPYTYFNTKCVNYNYIYGATILGNFLLLNTDRGLLKIEIPDNKTIKENSSVGGNNYTFILNYNDSLQKLENSDTLVILRNKRIFLDVIFPCGNGKPKYYYKITNSNNNPPIASFIELNANELNIPEWCLPDNYYTVYFYSDDDARKTDVQKFTIYISPKWWQTNFAKKMLLLGGVVFSILIIMISVYITRRIVLRAQFRKNLQMELELKSIHAQINPHFIFNTLNSALLLVSNKKMDEAYAHISRFSKLLRAYLKSSRNKYITINEEVNNLKNYLDLQQTRFKDKFNYEIFVSEEISKDLVKIPTLLIQPFAENAINHGILPKDGSGILKIEFRSKIKEGILQCIIDDDGVGRKKSKENNSLLGKKESYGNLLINDLIDIFNRYEDLKIDIVYVDKEPPLTGTTVTINIKNIKYG